MKQPDTNATLGDDELLQAGISDVLPFRGLNETQLRDILKCATIHRFDPQYTLFEQGDHAGQFFVLLDGYLRVVCSTQEGDQVVMFHVAPGEMFGIAKAFDNMSYTATARAASQGLALSWPSDLWNQFIESYPGFRSASQKAIGTRMIEMQDKIVTMATKPVEQRIAHAILRLMEQAGKETDDGVEINFPLTRQDISEMSGTTLHSVSRTLSNWQKSGFVRSARRRVVVCHPEGLPV